MILKRRNLEIRFFLKLLTKLSFKSNSKFRNLKITNLTNRAIKVFKYFQLIQINHRKHFEELSLILSF